MASFVDLGVKLQSIPPFQLDKVIEYEIKSGEFESTVVKASSTFEAAVKYAFCAKESQSGCFSTTVEVIDTQTQDRYSYDISTVEGDVTPQVELNHFEKMNPQLRDSSAEIGNHININMEPTFGVNVDLETGELIDKTLTHFFNFSSFRPLQRETIVLTMMGKDVMTVVGTGGGKSLMYLLPAVLSTKPTLVVSPVKSLIDDSLSRCHELDISACKFTGDLPSHQREAQLQNIGHFKVLFVTPEMLKDDSLNDVIVSLADQGTLERIVFDEAHTIINWGNTFRPVYKEVCEKLSNLHCPKLLLSATVPAKLEAEIKMMFDELTVLRSSIFRENLQFNVKERSKSFYDELEQFLKEHKDDCGIVYCVMPNDVSKVHAELVKRGFNCVKYHGQLSTEARTASHSKWMNGESNVIVANSSFGVGIDKQDVRFIVHAHVPTSMDEYYQQCGRAGRDGLPAICVLFYKYADKNSLFKLFKKDASSTNQMALLNELINFLENPVECRHKCLMVYFGEDKCNFACGTICDNCLSPGSYYLTDGTADAVKVVHAVVELAGKNVAQTMNMLKLFLAGSRQKCILENELDTLLNFGSLKNRFSSIQLLEKFLHSLLIHDVLAEVAEEKGRSIYLKLILGPCAYNLLALQISLVRYEKK